MSRQHKRDRDDNRRDRRDRRDRNDGFETRRDSDADRTEGLGSNSATATVESSGDDPIISGGRSSGNERSERHDQWDGHEVNDDPITAGGQSSSHNEGNQYDQDDDHGYDHENEQDDDRYGQVVTYHDESDHSYGSSDPHHDNHDDSDRLSLIAPSSDFF